MVCDDVTCYMMTLPDLVFSKRVITFKPPHCFAMLGELTPFYSGIWSGLSEKQNIGHLTMCVMPVLFEFSPRLACSLTTKHLVLNNVHCP